MTRQDLYQHIATKKSFLCVGLDTDMDKIPQHLLKEDDPIFAFNKQIIDATHEFCVAYKPNIAFYESRGAEGWRSLEKTMAYLNENHPEIFTIADAKRGDIGNTSKMYAKAFFEHMDFDAITVAPYMGSDSVKPFLEFENKWVILLALTSNQGAKDFQFEELNNAKSYAKDSKLFQSVIKTSQDWGTPENLMYVVGASRGERIESCRKAAPNHFFLVPGIGAQGGSFEEVCHYGLTADCDLLVNSSRGIIYASNGDNFAEKAQVAAADIKQKMADVLATR